MMNPLISTWLQPKRTARYVIDHKSTGYTMLILTLGYIGSLLASLRESDFVMAPVWLLIGSIVLAPVVAFIGNSILSWLYLKVGSVFDGGATYNELFKGISLSVIPYVILIPFYSVWLMTATESLINTAYVGPIPWYFLPTLLLTFFVSVWSFGISVATVAEAHQISIWKAFLTVVIPIIVIIVLLMPIVFIVSAFVF